MRSEGIRSAALPHLLSEVFADATDLFQKELRLALAELSAKLAAKLHAGIWMSAAGVLGFLALLVLMEAIIFFVASYGMALHWASLIVAAALALLAAVFFLVGRANARATMVPTRTIHNIKEDISTAKERLT